MTLIPKIKGATSFIDFRPTSLVNRLYKILLKVFSIRLKDVILLKV